MSTPPKTKAEFIAAIEEAKRLNEARLEPMREFRRLAESLLSSPSTTPEDIAWIEQRQQDVQTLLEANKAVERQIAALFFEHDLDALLANEGPAA